MSPTRREALVQLAALAALPFTPFSRWTFAADPLDGTIAAYQAGRRRGESHVTELAYHDGWSKKSRSALVLSEYLSSVGCAKPPEKFTGLPT